MVPLSLDFKKSPLSHNHGSRSINFNPPEGDAGLSGPRPECQEIQRFRLRVTGITPLSRGLPVPADVHRPGPQNPEAHPASSSLLTKLEGVNPQL